MARRPPASLADRQAAYDAAAARADEVMPRWLEARARGRVPDELEREALDAEAGVRRAAAKLAATRQRLGI